MKTLVGAMLFLGVILFTNLILTDNFRLGAFLDIPSLFIVLGTIVSLCVAKFSAKEMLTFSDEVVLGIINFSLVGGLLGFLIGLITMLKDLESPDIIGPSMGASLISVFYSIIISSLFYTLKKNVNTKNLGVASLTGVITSFISFFVLIFFFSIKQ